MPGGHTIPVDMSLLKMKKATVSVPSRIRPKMISCKDFTTTSFMMNVPM